MSAISNIAIQDGQATPVTHTFYPIQSDPSANYRESQSGLALVGQGRVMIAFLNSADAPVQKVRVQLELPALETVTGSNANGYTAAPKVGYTNKATLDLFLPARGTAAQRKDLRVLLINLLANAQVIDSIENLARPF